ncbi:MAG: DUF3006 domain-containing protein [Oscillospiraceae bacterium]|nr:DUF3006 domain-containing protein [Oscillospiraceae bacterium]
MKVVVDRVTEGVASVELPDGRTVNAPAALFDGAAEGDVVEIRVDRAETERRRASARGALERLKRRGGGVCEL